MRTLSALTAVLLISASPLHAQLPDTLGIALEPGSHLISVALPQGGGVSVAIGKNYAPDRQILWRVSAHASDRRTSGEGTDDEFSAKQRRFSLDTGPELRWYRSTAERVNAYGLVGIAAGLDVDREEGGQDTDQWSALTFGGLGLEWFPTARVSIRADAGLRLGVEYDHYQTGLEGVTQTHTWETDLDTFTSTLSLQLYTRPRR